MWKEIFVDDKEGLEEFVNIDNNFGCIAKLRPTTKEVLISILSKKKDAHAYIYRDNDFELLLLFVDKPDYILMLRYIVKWDYESGIDPKQSFPIIISKIRSYMNGRKKKVRISVFTESEILNIPNQHILEWYGDDLEEYVNTHGIKVDRQEKYWDLEVI